jgi:hypothetical protein
MEHQQRYSVLMLFIFVRLEAPSFNCIELQSQPAVSSDFLNPSQEMVQEFGVLLRGITGRCGNCVIRTKFAMAIKILSVDEARHRFPTVTTSKTHNRREYASGITEVR